MCRWATLQADNCVPWSPRGRVYENGKMLTPGRVLDIKLNNPPVPVKMVMIPGARAADNNNLSLHEVLVVEPCVILPDKEIIPLYFGTVESKALYLHTRTRGHAFSIHLTKCGPTIAKTAQVTFSDSKSSFLPGLLTGCLQYGAGIATGPETQEAKPVLLPPDGQNSL